tara:strand:+ start:27 stop:257 length:231 start_codon:yes stop_codon:yes gene_type:complete
MIDTDKYKGHDNWEGTKVNMANEANKLLIADAPLLLEAYKRLREVMIYVEQRQPHPALEWALKEGLTLAEIMERIE